MTGKTRTGYVMLVLAAVCWVAAPLLAFVQLPAKAAVITAIVIAGEVLFVLGLALAGRQVWTGIKQRVKNFLSLRKKQ